MLIAERNERLLNKQWEKVWTPVESKNAEYMDSQAADISQV